MDNPDLYNAVSDALVPTWSEIIRAKKAVISVVSDGGVHGIADLQTCLAVADGVRIHAGHGEELQVGPADDMSTAIRAAATRDHPLIIRNRLLLAACEAIVDLQAQGILVEAAEAPARREANHPPLRITT